uniref:Uncharacterized protein n=1 Tax=Chrysotila carterae TaxID=13221 RepID=A0A7S4F235_CHRCT
MAVFVIGSYVVFASYFVCDFHMMRLSSSYTKIPDEKKFYVLSNLIKAAVLLSYTPLAALTLYRALVRRRGDQLQGEDAKQETRASQNKMASVPGIKGANRTQGRQRWPRAKAKEETKDEWNTQRIRNLGVLYAIPDFVSLFLVSRMAFSTKLHHVCVVVFMVANLFNDYSDDGVGRALVVYAVFSTFAYLVNLLLASRFLQVVEPTSRKQTIYARIFALTSRAMRDVGSLLTCSDELAHAFANH